jgi:hypothetical protein
MKLLRPFSSFGMKGTLKEQWVAALHDPGYWLLWATQIPFLVFALILILKG